MAVKIRISFSKVSESPIIGVKERERKVELSKMRVYEERSLSRGISRVEAEKGDLKEKTQLSDDGRNSNPDTETLLVTQSAWSTQKISA